MPSEEEEEDRRAANQYAADDFRELQDKVEHLTNMLCTVCRITKKLILADIPTHIVEWYSRQEAYDRQRLAKEHAYYDSVIAAAELHLKQLRAKKQELGNYDSDNKSSQ